MAKRKKLKEVKQVSASLQNIVELTGEDWKTLINNQNSPIELVDGNGMTLMVLEPYSSKTITEKMKTLLDKSKNYKNLIDRGILSVVNYQ
jgi:hypothetical protein